MSRVMVVDDDEAVRLLFREELEADGYEVDLVRDARGLAGRIRASHPDVLVLDLGLGETDGRDVLADLRESFPELPVVIWSGYDVPPSEAQGLSAAYVVKSFDLTPLKRTISQLLRQRPPAATA